MWWAGFSVYFIIGFVAGWETTAKTTKSSLEQRLKRVTERKPVYGY